jgi:hypothetical protein
MTTLPKVLSSLRPSAEWHIHGETIDGLVWRDEVQTRPTDEEIEAEFARLEALEIEEAANKEAAKQAAEAKLAKLGLTTDDLKALLG